jgi:hypothetical protein
MYIRYPPETHGYRYKNLPATYVLVDRYLIYQTRCHC